MADAVLSDDEVRRRLQELPGWELRDGWIRRAFTTPGWPHTILLVNAIAYRAEAAFHHPDLSVGWAQVTVKLQTHSAGGITEKDLALAREVEAIATWQPPKGGPLEGFSKKWIR